MKIEHIAFNVADPPAVAAWYVRHLGMKVARSEGAPVYGHFLLDSSRAVSVEIYRNTSAPIPEYAAASPAVMHLAFLADNVSDQRGRLIAAGATAEGEVTLTPAGDEVAMLRDPWGLPIQLVRRAKPMV